MFDSSLEKIVLLSCDPVQPFVLWLYSVNALHGATSEYHDLHCTPTVIVAVCGSSSSLIVPVSDTHSHIVRSRKRIRAILAAGQRFPRPDKLAFGGQYPRHQVQCGGEISRMEQDVRRGLPDTAWKRAGNCSKQRGGCEEDLWWKQPGVKLKTCLLDIP